MIKDADVNRLSPPQTPSLEQAQADLNTLLSSDPAHYGIEQTRWKLSGLLDVLQRKGYRVRTPGSVHRLLMRLGLRWLKARYAFRSPDPFYQQKLAFLEHITQRVKNSQGREVLLYLDECNYYRQPTLSMSWTCSQHEQEKVKRSYRSDTLTRVLGTLDAATGKVMIFQAPKISVSDHVTFYKRVCKAYGQASRIWIVQDNNPVHFHPNLLAALEPQESAFPMTVPPNWPDTPKDWALKRFGTWKLPIQLVQIPTYAPWCNPIEKLWRKFRQDFTHLHQWIEDLETLRAHARAFFDQFAHGSADLLRYVGLGIPY